MASVGGRRENRIIGFIFSQKARLTGDSKRCFDPRIAIMAFGRSKVYISSQGQESGTCSDRHQTTPRYVLAELLEE